MDWWDLVGAVLAGTAVVLIEIACLYLARRRRVGRGRREDALVDVDDYLATDRRELINTADRIDEGFLLGGTTPQRRSTQLVEEAIATVRKRDGRRKRTKTEWTLRLTRVVCEQVDTTEREAGAPDPSATWVPHE